MRTICLTMSTSCIHRQSLIPRLVCQLSASQAAAPSGNERQLVRIAQLLGLGGRLKTCAHLTSNIEFMLDDYSTNLKALSSRGLHLTSGLRNFRTYPSEDLNLFERRNSRNNQRDSL